MIRITLAVLLALLAAVPARADLVIKSSPGGWVEDYLTVFSRVRQSGEKVIIDGPCLSACTLVLSTIPSNRICVTKRAVLGFHAPRIIIDSYPAGVRAWIKKRGGLSQKIIYLRGRELQAMYRRC